MVRIVRCDAPELWQAARRLVLEYAASLEIELDFQDFEHELEHLASEYGPPDGVFLLAHDDRTGEPFAGCGGIRRFSGDMCELKRLYVAPPGRNLGIGRTLAVSLIAEARALGYRGVLLDTLPSMHRAQELYRSLGFREVASYRFNPVPGSVFMRLDLCST